MKAWRDLKALPRGVWVLFVTTLVNRAGTMVLPFLILYLTRDLGFSTTQAGAVLGLYGAGALVSAAVSGRLSDLLGPMHVIRDSLFATGAILLVFPFARTFATVVAMTIALSLASEAFRPASMAVVADLVKHGQRKPAFALTRLAINLGMSIGPALGGYLATVSFKFLFLVNGTTSILAGVFLLLSLRRTPIHHVRAGSEPEGSVPMPSKRAWSDPRLLFFVAALFLLALVFFQHIAAMALFLVHDLHLTVIDYGLLFTINTLLIVALEVPLNSATAHWSHRKTLALGAFLTAAGFGALAFAWDFWSVTATVIVWTFGEMFFFPAMAAYATDIAPPSRRGEYMGMTQMAMSLAFAIGPWAGTAVLGAFGGKTLWLGAFAVGLVSTGMMLRMPDNAPPAHAGQTAESPSVI
ncbi:MAG TPA: MFS transporter [Thermoanaerobaculia bacterium]|nr:MFS transporter [Thermoanaerobaculia bacterium]